MVIMRVSIVMGVPENGWFIEKILLKWMIKIDLGVPLFQETPISKYGYQFTS